MFAFAQADVIRGIARLVEFYKHESCGQCTPCREGEGLHLTLPLLFQLLCALPIRGICKKIHTIVTNVLKMQN